MSIHAPPMSSVPSHQPRRPTTPQSEVIKEARLTAGLTQKQAAAYVGSGSYRTWQDWERGSRAMPPSAWELFLLKLYGQPVVEGVHRPLMKPFLKWAGNKFSLIDTIRPHLATHATRFIEPFAGSGALFLNTAYPQSWVTDANADLIHLFQCVQNEGMVFIDYARSFFDPANNLEMQYYALRDLFNRSHDSREKAALFLYLNRHGYNGLCRYNSKGGFNTPFGRYACPYFPDRELRYFHERAQGVLFSVADFSLSMADAGQGDVVYCDPPYVPLSPTASFTDYATGGFGMAQQIALAQAARAAVARGAQVIISNHDTPVTRDMYEGAAIHAFEVQRFISCKGKNRQKAPELLAVFTP